MSDIEARVLEITVAARQYADACIINAGAAGAFDHLIGTIRRVLAEQRSVRRLTDAEYQEVLAALNAQKAIEVGDLREAIQRKFCEVNGLLAIEVMEPK